MKFAVGFGVGMFLLSTLANADLPASNADDLMNLVRSRTYHFDGGYSRDFHCASKDTPEYECRTTSSTQMPEAQEVAPIFFPCVSQNNRCFWKVSFYSHLEPNAYHPIPGYDLYFYDEHKDNKNKTIGYEMIHYSVDVPEGDSIPLRVRVWTEDRYYSGLPVVGSFSEERYSKP
jgi:hypothetical protein